MRRSPPSSEPAVVAPPPPQAGVDFRILSAHIVREPAPASDRGFRKRATVLQSARVNPDDPGKGSVSLTVSGTHRALTGARCRALRRRSGPSRPWFFSADTANTGMCG